jgi:hypothetical protein
MPVIAGISRATTAPRKARQKWSAVSWFLPPPAGFALASSARTWMTQPLPLTTVSPAASPALAEIDGEAGTRRREPARHRPRSRPLHRRVRLRERLSTPRARPARARARDRRRLDGARPRPAAARGPPARRPECLTPGSRPRSTPWPPRAPSSPSAEYYPPGPDQRRPAPLGHLISMRRNIGVCVREASGTNRQCHFTKIGFSRSKRFPWLRHRFAVRPLRGDHVVSKSSGCRLLFRGDLGRVHECRRQSNGGAGRGHAGDGGRGGRGSRRRGDSGQRAEPLGRSGRDLRWPDRPFQGQSRWPRR